MRDDLIASEQARYDILIDYINKHIYGKEYKEEAIKLVDELVEELIEGADYRFLCR